MQIKVLKYREHTDRSNIRVEDSAFFSEQFYEQVFSKVHRGKDSSLPCFIIKKHTETNLEYTISTGYFIGVDWIEVNKTALHVAPKLNNDSNEVDYIKMLFSALRHPEASKEINELFVVKWDKPKIEIEQKQDLLTPFLVVEFLSLLKHIVRKGLKKSYYKVERNLRSRVKGKILVSKTVKHNLLQSKPLLSYCTFDEFGLNNKENRLLKKALVFVKKYLPTYIQLTDHAVLQNTLNYINPAFDEVSEDIDLNEIKHYKSNSFYKEYDQAIRLAKLILKRFGYNISNTVKDKIATPPFWIDMSKLFELYVLGLLKDRFRKDVKYQYKYYGSELDYLLNADDLKMIIDAKYKLKYINGKYDEDIRQVSGYARLKKVYQELEMEQGQVIDCLIIHPDQVNGNENLLEVDFKEAPIQHYYDVYKIGVKLPVIK